MIFQMSCALSHQQITIQPSCEVSSYVQTIFRKMAHFPWSSHDFPMISPSKAPARGPRAAPARRTSWGFWGPDAGCCGRSQVGLQPIHWDLRNWGASKFEDFPSFGWCCDVMGVEYRIVCQLSLSLCLFLPLPYICPYIFCSFAQFMLCPFQQTINRGYGILPIMEMILRIFNPNSLVIKWMS